MADGVCIEGTGDTVKDSVVKQSVDLLSISHKDCLDSNGVDTLKSSFYIDGESGDLCSINGVVGLGVREAMVCSGSQEFCPANGDNCRKKRCTDRYDSSESSDSGVAALSCTDCSTSSSGTSDITDPGSPYSTHSSASEGSDDCSPRKNATTTTSLTPPYCGIVTPPVQTRHWSTAATAVCKTASAASAAPTAWPWGGKEAPVTANTKPLKRQTAISSHKTARVNKVTSLATTQGKITEYFKTQVKPLKFYHSDTRKFLETKRVPTPTPVEASPPPPEPKTIIPEAECAAAPILSVPTTIRFPASDSSSGCSVVHPKPASSQSESPDSIACRWSECDTHFDSGTGLLEHLQAKHVNPQVSCENYVCLWVGCKVYARTSCSRSWLERHVLSHGGNKPFRCIVDGCGHRFSSQTTLERHVNGHFNQTETGNGNSGPRRSLESASSKLFRRNGKKLRYRRQPWSARMFDYFDAGIMEGLQHRLISMSEMRTQGNIATAAGNTVSLHSKVLARRVEPDGRMRILVRWYPEDILPDEWVSEAEAKKTCSVPIPSLPASAMTSLQSLLFKTHRNKQRRKPLKCST
ncbi:hypothetical protein L9F63_000647 [Diploptera punctata]|uniref:C2H2-type domain-containing protein n=1 Tax=Diploptera punctata TaxID=6984 RepID=A0AAD8AL64_DIPPU|nr:hypothetical protein L9F63_000647 [Diploptera punctata]